MGRRAWVIATVATGALWFTGSPADAWHAKTSVAPSCSGLHVRLVVTFENEEQANYVQFLATWTHGPPGADKVSMKYDGLDCRAPTPVLADGLNGVSLLGLGALALPGVVMWRRRRLHRVAA